MRQYLLLCLVVLMSLTFGQCSQKTGCPGVKEYTSSKTHKEKKKGLVPWSRKSAKKDNKKASSGLYTKKAKKKVNR